MPTVYDYKTAIVDVINRRGEMQKDALKIAVCSILSIETEDYNDKTFYRHMQQLVDELAIDVVEDPISKRKTWLPFGGESKALPNSGIITENNGFFFCPTHMHADTALARGEKLHDKQDELLLYFNLNHEFLCLRVKREAFPFKLHVARKTEERPNQIITRLTDAHGKRTMILHLPVPSLSSLKENANTGHLLFQFENDHCVLQDLQSSNGTVVKNVEKATAEKMIKSADIMGKNTVTEDWAHHAQLTTTAAILDKGKTTKLERPFVAMLGSDFSVLCYWG